MNSSMQGRHETIISGDVSWTQKKKKQIKKLIKKHLSDLQEGISKYFSSISTTGWKWLIAPDKENVSKVELNTSTYKQLIEISSNTVLRSKFQENALDVFCISIRSEYLDIANKAISLLLPLSMSYPDEFGFSTL